MKKKKVQARLARGFGQTDLNHIDSPVCSKKCLLLLLTALVSKGRICNSIDVKAAFLQSKALERVAFIKPPPPPNRIHRI